MEQVEVEQGRQVLEPCPFCGGDAELLDWDFPYRRFQVRCSKCGATASGRRAHATEAIEHWNERPIERELLEALKRCAADLKAEIQARYDGLRHPAMDRRLKRDMVTVEEAEAAIAKAQVQP